MTVEAKRAATRRWAGKGDEVGVVNAMDEWTTERVWTQQLSDQLSSDVSRNRGGHWTKGHDKRAVVAGRALLASLLTTPKSLYEQFRGSEAKVKLTATSA